MQKKILLLETLINPKIVWGRFHRHRGIIPPMGLIAIYTYMKTYGFDITFLDTNVGKWDEETLRLKLAEDKYDIVGISVFTTTADASFTTAKIVRDVLPNCLIVFGGIHPTILPEQTLNECPECNLLILGEGERTFRLCVESIKSDRPFYDIPNIAFRNSEGKPIVNSRTKEFFNLDELPVGFYSDIDLKPYIPHVTQYKRLPNYPLIIQRGCPFRCIFCEASSVHGKKVRSYSCERVIRELKILIEKKGARGVYFQDSTFTVNKKFVISLCELMIKEQIDLAWSCTTRTDMLDRELMEAMKKSGCWQLLFGIESANQQSLDLLKKGTTVENNRNAIDIAKEFGVQVSASYILAIPGEDEEMVQNTIDFANEMATESALFYLPTPYPGAELYKICKAEGTLREDAQWEEYLSIDYDNPIYVNPKLGVEKMKYYYKKAYKSYYSNPRVYLANLKAFKSWDDLKRAFRAARIFVDI